MFEWALIFNGIERVFIVLATIAGWMIRRSLQRREEIDKKIESKLDAILVQVNATNGRVIALEEWKRNHTKGVDELHKDLRSSLADLWTRLNSYIDGRHNHR